MSQQQTSAVAAAATSIGTVIASLTLSDWAQVVGIVGTIITVAVFVVSHWRRDRREQLAFEIRHQLIPGRRMTDRKCVTCAVFDGNSDAET